MPGFMFKNASYTLGSEIAFDPTKTLTVSLLKLILSTTATSGARQFVLSVMASTKAIYALCNALKVSFNALLPKLDADAGVVSTDYTATFAVSAALANSLATGYTLANSIKTQLNLALTHLDADTGVTDTNFNSTHVIAAANGTTQATLVTLLNQELAYLNSVLSKLDADAQVTDVNFRSLLDPQILALTTVAAGGGSTNASATVAASLARELHFSTAFGSSAAGSYIFTNLSTAPVVSALQSLYITDSSAVDSADGCNVLIEAA
jgi:hypothetical protein